MAFNLTRSVRNIAHFANGDTVDVKGLPTIKRWWITVFAHEVPALL